MSGGTISYCSSGIFVLAGTLTLSGGTISDNDSGISVHANAAISGTALIKGNISGISISEDGSAAMTGGTITENGTGVLISNSSYAAYKGYFTMSGGSVTKNTDGIEVSGLGCFSLNNGNAVISENTGNGVIIIYGGEFIMSGSAKVNVNNPVILVQNEDIITLQGALSSNPAANINPSLHSSSSTLLSGSVSGNYTKFQVNGATGKINSSGQYTP
jgi:hypothetical protein